MEGWWQTWTILAVLLVAGVRMHMAAADRGNLRDKFHSEVAGELGVPPGGGAPPRPPPQESPDQTAQREANTPPESDFLVKPSEDSPPKPPSLPEESPKENRKYDFKLEPAPVGFQPPPSFNANPQDLEAYFSNGNGNPSDDDDFESLERWTPCLDNPDENPLSLCMGFGGK